MAGEFLSGFSSSPPVPFPSLWIKLVLIPPQPFPRPSKPKLGRVHTARALGTRTDVQDPE